MTVHSGRGRAEGAGSSATAGVDQAGAFVLANATLRPVPLVPEISLHLADDAFAVWEATESGADPPERPPPFWAFAWPGGQALARYVLDHRDAVAGRSVLDVGSGSGLAGIAAAMAGASVVLASEVDQFAMAATGLNAAANGVQVTVVGDVLDGAGEDAQVILCADIWYERRLAHRALSLIRKARARGSDVLVGDIGRTYLPRPMLRELAAYDVPVLAQLEDASVKRAMVLAIDDLEEKRVR